MQIGGQLTANLGSSDLVIENSTIRGAQIQSGSGNISVDGIQGAVRARTGSGDISVALPADANLQLEAQTGSGNIKVARMWNVSGDSESQTRSGQIGAGRPLLRLNASSGNIEVKPN